jgi:hypothetical protein
MPPELAKLLQSLLGVFFVFGLVYWLFPRNKKLDVKIANADLIRCYPETRIQNTIVSDDFKTAIILTADHSASIGVTKILGDRTVTKLFTSSDIEKIQLPLNAFHLHVNDFTFPPLDMSMPEEKYDALKAYITASEKISSKVKNHAL